MGTGLDQFQVWKLFSEGSAHKGVYVVPILDLVEAIILAVPFCLDHGLVRPCMTLKGDQGIECPVDADQRFANHAIVRERIDGFPHVLRAGHIVIICKRSEARKSLAIIWVKLADIQAFGDFP